MRVARPISLLALLVALPVNAQAPAQAPAPAPVVNKVTADLGYVQTSGNTAVTTTSVGEKWTQSRGLFTLEQTFSFVYGEQAGVEVNNTLATGLRGDYKLGDVLSVYGDLKFDRAPFSGISRRTVESFGLQLLAVAAPRDSLRLSIGASVTQQLGTDGNQNNFPAANAGFVYRHMFTAAAYFQQNVEAIPNLKDQDDLRVSTESALVAPISARIGMKISYIVRFDNVPEPTFKSTDRIFTTGLQITF
jgi:putative salt-induced outer membrane protein